MSECLIPLLSRTGEMTGEAIVDVEDYDSLMAYRWIRMARNYAARWVPRPERRSVYMHRQVMGLSFGDPRWVNHINRNKLDNRRANLRIIPRTLSQHNLPSRGGSSIYRGVSWHEKDRRWRARASLNGASHFLGNFTSEEAAAAAAQEWRLANMEGAVD